MALIKCSECGREVSDKAMACPHCGAPIASQNVRTTNVYVAPTPTTVRKKQVIVVNHSHSNGCGTAGFVFSLLALFLGWIPFVGWVLWFLGFLFSLIGLFRSPRTLAVIGMIFILVDFVVIILLYASIAAA